MPAYNYYSPNVYPGWVSPNGYSPYAVPQQNMSYAPSLSGTQYMYQVDGEIGAHAWQPQGNAPLGPNTVVPLFDFDGIHVYFKTTDAYGRMNPMRKGRIVFDDEQQALPQSQNNVSGSEQPITHSENFVTKDDFNELKNEIRQMMAQQNVNRTQTNQNGNSSSTNTKGGRNG